MTEEEKISHNASETTVPQTRIVDEEFLQAKDLINLFIKTIKIPSWLALTGDGF